MKTLIFEAKNDEEALAYAAKEMRVNPSYITLSTAEKKGMLGLKKSVEYTAKVNINLLDFGYDFLKAILEQSEIEATIEAELNTETEAYHYTIDSPNNPLLIGKGGKTLHGFQTYLRNLMNLYDDKNVNVILDIGDYKANRERQIEILATKTAKEVARSGIPATLRDLNAYERRIVHTKLAEWRDVTTVSEGERPNRHIVIKPSE